MLVLLKSIFVTVMENSVCFSWAVGPSNFNIIIFSLAPITVFVMARQARNIIILM